MDGVAPMFGRVLVAAAFGQLAWMPIASGQQLGAVPAATASTG
jgi:hypothetical protein